MLSRSLTELTADVKETFDAIEAVANDDAQLAAICLSERDDHSELLPALLKCVSVLTHPQQNKPNGMSGSGPGAGG